MWRWFVDKKKETNISVVDLHDIFADWTTCLCCVFDWCISKNVEIGHSSCEKIHISPSQLSPTAETPQWNYTKTFRTTLISVNDIISKFNCNQFSHVNRRKTKFQGHYWIFCDIHLLLVNALLVDWRWSSRSSVQRYLRQNQQIAQKNY